MRKHHLLTHVLLGLGLLALANLVPQTFVGAAEAQAPALAPGAARVWFLRSAGSLNGNVWAAEPEIYANGAPVGDIPVGSKFYREFPAGDIPLCGAVIRPADRCGRYRISGAWNANLSRNRMVGKLAGGLPRGRL